MADSDERTVTKFQKSTPEVIHRSEINNAPYNPRQIKATNKRRLRDGIKKHGLVGSITWNRQTGNIVGGHRRIESIDELEKSEDYSLSVDVIDVPIQKERALNLLLNNKSAQGEDNLIALQGVLELMVEEGTAFEDAGYTSVDIQNILPDAFPEPEVAEQMEAELPTIDSLGEMKQAGKEEDEGFRQDMREFEQQNGLETKQPPVSQVEASGEAVREPAEPGKDWQHSKDYFKDSRQKTVENNKGFRGETNVILSLFFQDSEQLAAFQNAFALSPRKTNYDIFEIQESFGIELPAQAGK